MTLWPLCPDPRSVQQATSVTFNEVWPISSVMMSCNSQLSWLLTFCKAMRCTLLGINSTATHKSLKACRKKPSYHASASDNKTRSEEQQLTPLASWYLPADKNGKSQLQTRVEPSI